MKKILIVEDDITLRTALNRHLEALGYLVEIADSGSAGLAKFEHETPDLVVSDVVMPEMDGFEFCRRLRATRLGQLVPFIFLSSRAEIDDRIQGHNMGADDYLIKPFETRELVAKIEAQLERSRRMNAEILRLMQAVPTENGTKEAVSPEPNPKPLPLTPAEEKVFWQVIQGHSNKKIAQFLVVSPRTVQTHLSNILSKLQLGNRSQLVRYAYEHGYRPPMEDDSSP